ncbi:hypothetical protein Trydic_g5537 [Trypoxylus dichotomus]
MARVRGPDKGERESAIRKLIKVPYRDPVIAYTFCDQHCRFGYCQKKPKKTDIKTTAPAQPQNKDVIHKMLESSDSYITPEA